MSLDCLTDLEMINILKRRGYYVRHKDEARWSLSWHRVEPLPKINHLAESRRTPFDFKDEALIKLREQVTVEMIEFLVQPAAPPLDPLYPDSLERPATYSACLRVLY